jgi:phospholipase C
MVTLYENRDFSGASITVGDGATRFPTPAEFNDAASSIRVPAGYCAVLYEDANENGGYGAMIDLLEDCADLSVYGFDKKTSYVSVFRTESESGHIYVRGSQRDGNFVPGHWERKRANGSNPNASVAIVAPPVSAPTTLQQHTVAGPVVRDHRGEDDENPSGGVVVHDTRPSKIKHVFVLMLENRSFDHMLGFSAITGTDAQTGSPTSINGLTGNESNSYNGVTYTVSHGAPNVAAHDPGHGFPAVLEQLCGEGARYEIGKPYPPINNSGFVANYARGHPELPDGAMKCFTPDQVPVITALAQEFLVCDRWFCSMPGPTEPNRWFVHAATAGNLDEGPGKDEYFEWMTNPWGGFEFERGTIYDLLRKAHVKFRIYAGDELPSVALLDGVSRTFDVDDFDDDFAEDVASPSYDAAYTFIEPSYDVFSDFKDGSSQHPLGSVVAGERLIKRTYEALRRSPIWESSLLVVLYDEHGGFYDHVAPSPARATGSKGRRFGFAFDQLGPRVPAIIVSPLIPRNQIDHRRYEHSSVISTLIELFRLDRLTARSSASSGFAHLATLPAPRTDAPMTLPDPMRGAVARMVKIPFSDKVAEKPDALLSDDPHGTIALALRSGFAQHLEVTPPSEHEAIRARVAALRTRAEALQYLKDVVALVKHARAEAGVQRSATVRTHRQRSRGPRGGQERVTARAGATG